MDPVASHSCHLLQQLHEQRIQGLLCDCMLVVKGVCFKAHKNVLAAFSQYFRCLFQNSPSQKNEVFNLEIKNIGSIGQILDFMYTSHLDLNQDNIQAVMDIAQYLQVHIVLNMCHTFLKPTVVVESSSTSSSNDFPLLRSSIIDSDCFLSEHSKTDSLQDFATHCQSQANNAGNQPLDGTHCDKLYEASASCSKQTFDRPTNTELTGHHYKLRNFFSKQNKQNHNVKPDSNSGHVAPLIECAELNNAHSHSWNVSSSECASESINALPSNFSAASTNENTAEQDPERTSCQSMMRLKKAVHLKKLNFLRSQEAMELLPSEPEADDQSLRSDSEVANSLPIDDNAIVHSIEKEADLPFTFNGSEQSVEEESYQSISESKDNPRTSELQRLYDCELCGKNFKHPSNLELHKRSHTGEKPFECVVCGKRFSQAGNLQTHLRRHSGEKPYICEICGKRFAASGDVQRHIVIHTGEKPNLCDTCGRGFSNFSNLKEHKKTHAADKVFTCDECGKSFNMHQKLIKHGIRHTGERPYSCSACGKRFAGSGDLCRHLRTHTGEKPYACESCNKCFSRPAVLRRHKRTHCKASEEDTTIMLEEFSQTMDISDQERSESNDSFIKNISVTTLPVSIKISNDSRTEIDKSPTDMNFKMQSMIEHHKVTKYDKLSSKTAEISRHTVLPASPPQAYVYEEADVHSSTEPLQSDNPVMIRPSMGTMNTQFNEPESNRATPVAYRSSEGPFYSSMTLWGFAMKTLQDESELDQ